MRKEMLSSVRINDPSSTLLKELLKHNHNQSMQSPLIKTPVKNKLSCYKTSRIDSDSDSDNNPDQPMKIPIRLSRMDSGLVLSESPSRSDSINRNSLKTLDNDEEKNDQLDSTIQSNQNTEVIFESVVKRKCIIKNFRKPRFSQWKSYWLQLVGGHLLIYYLPKSSQVFNTGTTALKPQFNKSACKMHSIAGWMVVNLFENNENEQKSGKYDVQLNDLGNGNMYKYRFDNAQLAKQWHEQLLLASTYHERLKPDNLIRFD